MAKQLNDYSDPKLVSMYKKKGLFVPSGHEEETNRILEKTDMGGMKDKGGKAIPMKKTNTGTGKKIS